MSVSNDEAKHFLLQYRTEEYTEELLHTVMQARGENEPRSNGQIKEVHQGSDHRPDHAIGTAVPEPVHGSPGWWRDDVIQGHDGSAPS